MPKLLALTSPGDFNVDGEVDNEDLNLLLANWGSDEVPDSWLNGLAEAPIDNGELNALLGSWGQSGFGSGVTIFEVGPSDPAPELAGDFNDDGIVDNGDLNLLLGNLGSTTVPPEWINGFVGPQVDFQEANAVLRDWSFGTGAAAIPEPAGAASLLALLAFTAAYESRERPR